jgi:hypothetical protein
MLHQLLQQASVMRALQHQALSAAAAAAAAAPMACSHYCKTNSKLDPSWG